MSRVSDHPNDTLNGALEAWEYPDQRHLRNSFGYWRMVEERMVRAHLIDAGIEPTTFAISAEVSKNHANDLSLREYQDQVLKPRWAAQFTAERAERESHTLTREEWARLAERFDGANDPIGQSILTKALANLKQLEHISPKTEG